VNFFYYPLRSVDRLHKPILAAAACATSIADEVFVARCGALEEEFTPKRDNDPTVSIFVHPRRVENSEGYVFGRPIRSLE
jgi:hypothetical protein